MCGRALGAGFFEALVLTDKKPGVEQQGKRSRDCGRHPTHLWEGCVTTMINFRGEQGSSKARPSPGNSSCEDGGQVKEPIRLERGRNGERLGSHRLLTDVRLGRRRQSFNLRANRAKRAPLPDGIEPQYQTTGRRIGFYRPTRRTA